MNFPMLRQAHTDQKIRLAGTNSDCGGLHDRHVWWKNSACIDWGESEPSCKDPSIGASKFSLTYQEIKKSNIQPNVKYPCVSETFNNLCIFNIELLVFLKFFLNSFHPFPFILKLQLQFYMKNHKLCDIYSKFIDPTPKMLSKNTFCTWKWSYILMEIICWFTF